MVWGWELGGTGDLVALGGSSVGRLIIDGLAYQLDFKGLREN